MLFASDWITVHRLPFGPIGDAETAVVKTIEAMDFEHFVCSHGMLGKKADVTASIRYREVLRDAVAAAIAAGQTLEQAQAAVRWTPIRTGSSTRSSARRTWRDVSRAQRQTAICRGA